VRTPEREYRAPKNARRLAATASLAAATIVGTATVGAIPAHASGTPAAPATTPIATLEANRLASAGSATLTLPNYDHAYRFDFTAVTVDGAKVHRAVNAKPVAVKTDIRAEIVTTAAKQKGKPYRFGADGPNSFDCSGLVKYVFSKYGIKLPHNSSAQLGYGKRVSKNNAKPGDLVFVMSGSHATHVAIYAGNGTWWEAPHTGARVRHVKIWSTNVQYRRIA
jgi:cell wall-associated NlpC family hydrolase